MENRYYTPRIEEFYVGFECEFFNYMADKVWKHEVCNVDLVVMAYDNYEHENYEGEFSDTFRVKYLDKEDIESLGFVSKESKDEFGRNLYTKCIEQGFNTYYIVTIAMPNKCTVYLHIKYSEYGSWGGKDYSFNINIKNKSELKILLKQLGINIPK